MEVRPLLTPRLPPSLPPPLLPAAGAALPLPRWMRSGRRQRKKEEDAVEEK